MSAEGKKKRGDAGRANANASPFRLNGGGCYPLYMRKILGNLSFQIGRPASQSR
jgi:hypothetical protein